MNSIREIQRINEAELRAGVFGKGSWHDDYKHSAYIYIGGLPYNVTEGDIICIFSQFGEPLDVNLVRDKDTGKSKGFCFLKYEDQRSTVLAVDNFTGAKILGRVIRVDHVADYKQAKKEGEDGEKDGGPEAPRPVGFNIAPKELVPGADDRASGSDVGEDDAELVADIDPEDPMREYLLQQRREEREAHRHSRRSRDREGHRSRRDKSHRSRDGHRSREERHRSREEGHRLREEVAHRSRRQDDFSDNARHHSRDRSLSPIDAKRREAY